MGLKKMVREEVTWGALRSVGREERSRRGQIWSPALETAAPVVEGEAMVTWRPPDAEERGTSVGKAVLAAGEEERPRTDGGGRWRAEQWLPPSRKSERPPGGRHTR